MTSVKGTVSDAVVREYGRRFASWLALGLLELDHHNLLVVSLPVPPAVSHDVAAGLTAQFRSRFGNAVFEAAVGVTYTLFTQLQREQRADAYPLRVYVTPSALDSVAFENGRGPTDTTRAIVGFCEEVFTATMSLLSNDGTAADTVQAFRSAWDAGFCTFVSDPGDHQQQRSHPIGLVLTVGGDISSNTSFTPVRRTIYKSMQRKTPTDIDMDPAYGLFEGIYLQGYRTVRTALFVDVATLPRGKNDLRNLLSSSSGLLFFVVNVLSLSPISYLFSPVLISIS